MDARDFAVLTLDEKQLPGLPRQAFKRRSPVPPEDPRDRALGEQIVAGVVKNFLHLDRLVSLYANRASGQIDARAKLILMVALYQIRMLDRVPDHAAVTEAVRQTRTLDTVSLPRASGFVNAVLRHALRDSDAKDKLPKRSDPAAYAEEVLSHPRALFERLQTLLGTEDAFKFCEHDNRTPPTLVRLNPGVTIEQLAAEAQDVVLLPHEQPGMVVAQGGKQADYARWSELGLGQVQDATSAAVVEPLGVEPGMTVLDRCCGVGTKTQQLAGAVGQSGQVFAVDALGARINTLRRFAGRRGDLSQLKAKRAEWMEELPEDWPGTYDRILIDAPCSNSGVLARRPEARYHQFAEAQGELIELQKRILADTWPAVSDSGKLAYATCSVWPEENGGVIDAFLAEHPEAKETHRHAWLPSFETDDPTRYRDGGFVAVLEK